MNFPSFFDLRGRSALITGSTRGIGRAIATTFAQAGADIILHATAESKAAEQTLEEIRALGVKGVFVAQDLSAGDAAECLYPAAVAGMGSVDILVANASVQIPQPWKEGTREDFHLQIEVNLRSTYELLKLSAPSMQERGWGRIVTVGSVQESKPHPDMLVYAASKCAQTSMVRNLAKQLAPFGVTANNLAPGVIRTDRNNDRLANAAYRDVVLNKIPAAQIGQPEDCAGAALLLCSEAGRYITGQNLYVDGGMSL